MSWLDVHIGDCRDVLDTLPERSVHCVVTSPPYWGLRDYGVPSQIGLEPTAEMYVAGMVAVFRQLRRVLRDDGTVWLNLGDTYSSGGRDTYGPTTGKQATHDAIKFITQRPDAGLKPKDLVGIPWRVAFALQADGWYLRSDIIWSKPNPMPESVTDRPTKSHEYLFLLSKRDRYYFDQEAVREVGTGRTAGNREYKYDGLAGHETKQGILAVADKPWTARNIRSVWTVATQPYPGAHFAVFPEALVEPCIKAGTSERGVCGECGAPWRRVVETRRTFESGSGRAGNLPVGKNGHGLQGGGETVDIRRGPVVHATTTGWRPTCAHDAEPVPATVLDPFGGSGTVARVANRLSRRAVLIELNPEYATQIEARNLQAPLGLGG